MKYHPAPSVDPHGILTIARTLPGVVRRKAKLEASVSDHQMYQVNSDPWNLWNDKSVGCGKGYCFIMTQEIS